MRSSKRHKQSGGFVRSLTLLGLVIGPATAIASCGSGGSSGSGEDIGQESLAQIACGGSTGGSVSRGGSVGLGGSITKGGTGGTGACPTDDCTVFVCKSGQCAISSSKKAGEPCDTPQRERGVCADVDYDGDRRPDFTQCCTACVTSGGKCVDFGDQSDAVCGNSGKECVDCGECRNCTASGTCAAASGSCTGGQCVGGNCCTGCIAGTTCYVDAAANCGANGSACVSCDDGKACTTDTCSNGSCVHTPVTTGPCDDGDACTVNDSCEGSTCGGTPKDCDDGNPCTDDDCDPQDGCTHDPAPRTCNDGNACTTMDSCNANGNCVGAAVVCNDGNQCTDDTCTPQMGCVYTSRAEGAMCNDGAACSTGDRCHDDDMNPNTPRVCEPTGGPNCEDGNPCTSDAADCMAMPPSCPHGPVNNGDPCSTGTLCFVGQTCQNGTCTGGSPLNCDDFNPCTSDACDAMTGCTHTPSNNGDSCPTGDPCFTDGVCQSGECVGEPIDCTSTVECLEDGECDDGSCSFSSKPNGSPCGRTGTCRNGGCEGDGVVDPTGGSGPGTAGGGPGGNDSGGTGTSGSAGEGTGDAGGGGSGNTSGGGSAGDFSDTPIFKREPGGCACRVPAAPASGDYGALAAATALALALRRRRRAA